MVFCVKSDNRMAIELSGYLQNDKYFFARDTTQARTDATRTVLCTEIVRDAGETDLSSARNVSTDTHC